MTLNVSYHQCIFFILLVLVNGNWVDDSEPSLHNATSCFLTYGRHNLYLTGHEEAFAKCNSIRYIPDDIPDFKRINPSFLFNKFPNYTFHFLGDSIAGQHLNSFGCYLNQYLSEFSAVRIPREDCSIPRNVCPKHNTHNGFIQINAPPLFQHKNVSLYLEFGGKNTDIIAEKSILIINYNGLHHMNPHVGESAAEGTIKEFKQHLPMLREYKKKGAIIIFRETTSAAFATTSGYWDVKITAPLQANKQAVCVDHTHMNETEAYRMSGNKEMNALILEEGFELLRVWNATFTSPPECRMGDGIDCVHFSFPGGITNYFNELLFHVLHKYKI